MLWQNELESDFRRLFFEQWRLSRTPDEQEVGDQTRHRDWLDEAFEDAAETACCPVTWLIPELMDLILRTADEPIERVRAEIHSLLTEQDFNEVSGDTINDALHRELVELYVDRLTRTVARVRRQLHHDRAQSNAPASDSSCFFG